MTAELYTCFVCAAPTSRIVSMSHVGAPTSPSDSVAICPACGAAWTAALIAIHAEERISRPSKKPPPKH